MLIFMKNVKKVLDKDETEAVIRYHAGRSYASNRYSCIWVEDASGREGERSYARGYGNAEL